MEIKEILAHIGLMTHTQQGRSAIRKTIIELPHYEMRYWDEDEFNQTKQDALLQVQLDRVVFTEKAKICAFF